MIQPDPVVSAQDQLGRVPEIFDPVDVISILGEGCGMADAIVTKGRDIQGVTSPECVNMDGTVRFNPLLNDGYECLDVDVGNDDRIHLATSLQQTKHSDLPTIVLGIIPSKRADRSGHERQYETLYTKSSIAMIPLISVDSQITQ